MKRFHLHAGKAAVKPLVGPAIALGLAVAIAATPTAALNAAPAAMQDNAILMSVGGSRVVNLSAKMSDVVIADPEVVDVHVRAQNQLYLIAKKPGETTVFVTATNGKVLFSGTVRVGNNLTSIDDMLDLAMPNANIAVNKMNGMVLLTGTIAAPEDAAEAERLTQAFVGKDVTVVSRLRTATPLQVNLRVRFAEVSRSLVRQLGVNLTTIDGTGGFQFGLSRGRAAATRMAPGFNPPLPLGMGSTTTGYTYNPATCPGLALTPPDVTGCVLQSMAGTIVAPAQGLGTIAGMGRFLGLDILGALDAGETMGLVSTLSEPNLTAMSGETGQFLAGGEFPIPLSQGLGTTTIEYKNYGVSLAYTPTVLANGRISIRVRPEVSELSSQGAVTVNNFTIPALTVRRAETTVELGSGQSFMIAGLMSNNAQNTIDKIPGAGDIPVLGSLFRSTEFRKGQTELVIVVTPYLVRPVNDSDIVLPTDGYQAPNAVEQFLGNFENGGVTEGGRPMPHAAGEAPLPAVGLEGSDAPAPVADNRRRPDQGAERADAAAPGFSIQ